MGLHVHGHARRGDRHPLYGTWSSIITRCTNPNVRHWPRYGGRGITIHPEWRQSFDAFLRAVTAEIGERPPGTTLDRIDNDGNYEPGNVRWATKAEQKRNARGTKLTADQAEQIRLRHIPNPGGNADELAAEFGVSACAVRDISAGRSWRPPGDCHYLGATDEEAT